MWVRKLRMNVSGEKRSKSRSFHSAEIRVLSAMFERSDALMKSKSVRRRHSAEIKISESNVS